MNPFTQFILRQLAERRGLAIVRVEETPGVIHVIQAIDPDWNGVSLEDRIAQTRFRDPMRKR